MNLGVSTGDVLCPDIWNRIRERAIFDCCKWDIQSEDHCVLCDFPLFIECSTWNLLAHSAAQLAREALNAEREMLARPDLHRALALPRSVRSVLKRAAVAALSSPSLRLMRFDFHVTEEGWKISEVNSDVPGGLIEASGFTNLIAEHFPDAHQPPDAAAIYATSIAKIAGASGAVALVHATAHSDDRQVMEFLARRLRTLSLKPVLTSPATLDWRAEVPEIRGLPIRCLIRFFPADWLPQLRKHAWVPWFTGAKTPMSNPGTALLTQSKRFPLVWDSLQTSLFAWRTLLPESVCPSRIRDKNDPKWIFKPVFGRVGEDILSTDTQNKLRSELLRDVSRHPERWVAQRRFTSAPIQTPHGPMHVCVGVFTLDAQPVGVYGRISSKAIIDQDAQDIAVLIRSKESRR